MATKLRWLGPYISGALLVAPIVIAQAENNQQQQTPVQRDDPATSGAGPTSRAPGQYDYDDRKGGPPTTTDARGVTTQQPQREGTTQPPRDQGNESMSSTPPPM